MVSDVTNMHENALLCPAVNEITALTRKFISHLQSQFIQHLGYNSITENKGYA